MRTAKLVGLCGLIAWLCATPVHAGEVIALSARGHQGYVVNDAVNPELTLKRGVTYALEVNSPAHPLWIKTAKGTGKDNAFTDGVTGNGTGKGTITFAVPASAPGQLFYNCQFHPMMYGMIKIVD